MDIGIISHGCIVLQQRAVKAGTRLWWNAYRLRCSVTGSRSPGFCQLSGRYPVCCNDLRSSRTSQFYHPRQTLERSYDQPQHNIIRAESNVTIGSTCHHSAASQTQRIPRGTTDHNREKNNQVLAGMLQYVQVTPKGNLVERTVCPHELAVPLLDLLQARQAVARLTSLPAAERTGCRDLHALCCVTSTLLGNALALTTGT